MMAGIWAGVAVAVLLAGCAAAVPAPSPDSPSPDSPSAEARAPLVAPGERLDLPRPADLGRSVEAVQMITARHGDRTYVFEGHLSVTAERLVLAGLDGMGRRAMTITWTGDDTRVETAPWLPEGLRPGSMLADLVLLYWPEAAVRRALAPTGGELIAETDRRTVRIDGRDVLRATYGWPAGGPWTGTLRYENLGWGYAIEVRSVEAQTVGLAP
ncbi:DUF3261 domain-containing protein [Azospirillum sp. SYSU D00513]|uniref:DUF3261 domain-containing protein n=1 Tax=Azospirillum sp. SYSU D00513 TaxID=2812561 RepID=UPI001A968EA8|nr:DUF3261 domain-containing protein [Azospirillum sp. SYSU D00513]